MKISVVIRAYNEAEHIGRLLFGIQRQTVQPHEVIVVDSGSTDSTVSIARSYGATIVHISKDSFTFGRSLNQGIAAATGDTIVIASAHVYPTKTTWLERLCLPLGNNKVVLSYGKQRGNEKTKFSEHRVFETWFPEFDLPIQKNYFCNNANCAILKSEWEHSKYDENLTGLEDLAWAKAAQARGGNVAYAADACIVHVHDESWKQVRNRYRREAMAMKSISGAHFGLPTFYYCLITNIAADLGVALKEQCFRREALNIFRFRYNQFFGTYLGYNKNLEIEELKNRFYYSNNKDLMFSQQLEDKSVIDYETYYGAQGSSDT